MSCNTGIVSCNCYKEGKTTDFPYKQFIRLVEDTYELDLPYEGNEEIHEEFDDWLENKACDHENMVYESQYLYLSPGIDRFSKMLEIIGEENFPDLYNFFLKQDDFFPVERCRGVLKDMEKLERWQLSQSWKVLLENGEIFRDFYYSSESSYNFFDWGSGYDIELNRNGIVIREMEMPYCHWIIIFESSHFTQKNLSDSRFEFTCLRSGETVIVGKHIFTDHPELMTSTLEYEISSVKVNINEYYKPVILAIKKLALAALETGNPVYWY